MTGKLILLTGATGHIGFRTLRYALEYGYNVRAAVRSEEKAEIIRRNPALKEIKHDNLSFVIIPDITIPGAYDAATEGVQYIIHLASPLASPTITGDFENLIVKPAVLGTIGLLESARRAGSVARVVITSSSVTTVPVSLLLGTPTDEVFGPDYRAEEIPAPYHNHFMVAYVASKIAALRRAEAWMSSTEVAFDMITIHPSFVLGRDDLTNTIEGFESGTNSLALGPLLGKIQDNARSATTVHVDDVALAHVLSLNPKISGGQAFLLSNNGYDGMQWDHAKMYAAKHFPEAVERNLLPNNGSTPSRQIFLDTTKTEQVLGIKLKTFEEQVVSVAGHYLEILERNNTRSTHKALAIHTLGQPPEFIERQTPTPKDDEILLKVSIVGLNPHDASGKRYGLFIKDNLPSPFGVDIVGEVISFGRAVTKYKVGDHVFAFGIPFSADSTGTQEYCVLPAWQSALLPEGISADEAATFPLNAMTMVFALFHETGLNLHSPFGLQRQDSDYSKETILFIGGGSATGKFGIQLARLANFKDIIVVASKARESELKNLGATVVVDRTQDETQIEDNIRKVIGDNLIFAVDCVGRGPDGQTLGVKALSNHRKGTLVALVKLGGVDESRIGPKTAGYRTGP
ncbi:NAD(P)-binding protein [Myriangium duriaei CBS 260.36]|uniref:NAD(P)-binding protein n=1 Tax=Myriangium duriaei CBS 260.36 TaxID=1168546 RepID=A0A9P4MQC8_9PEZI|nr:NAD(P)-binding protein [Myriangium duriaei CBS 260.36]